MGLDDIFCKICAPLRRFNAVLGDDGTISFEVANEREMLEAIGIISRHAAQTPKPQDRPFSANFEGERGTGKSTAANAMAEILTGEKIRAAGTGRGVFHDVQRRLVAVDFGLAESRDRARPQVDMDEVNFVITEHAATFADLGQIPCDLDVGAPHLNFAFRFASHGARHDNGRRIVTLTRDRFSHAQLAQ